MNKNATLYNQTDFANLIGVTQGTISRWMSHKECVKRFKWYNAEIVEIAGKKLIKVRP